MRPKETALQRLANQTDVLTAVGLIGLIGIMIVPLPPALLDILLTLNIALSLTIMLVAMYVSEPLEFSVFPSLLLVATLFRLALNISSTRLILLYAHAGHVIDSFGQFVVGGDLIVGLIIFLILIVIQFVVITSGSQRVAEVAARFTLDELPGKQLSIDADLNAGLIGEAEAKARRRDLEREADFYGAMDGASKFVRGDAIASVVIVAINILGGLIIGMVRMKMPVGEALQTFSLLTVGDGLVAQIPALLISTATGLVVTRSAAQGTLGMDLRGQIMAQPKALLIVGAMLAAFGLVPGLPTLAFATVGGGVLLLGWRAHRGAQRAAQEPSAPALEQAARPETPEDLIERMRPDPLSLEVGFGLVPLAEASEGGGLLARIPGIRRDAANELGIVLPPIRIRDNFDLDAQSYEIKIRDAAVARGALRPNRLLAMPAHPDVDPVRGEETKEPVFGLKAYWVNPDDRAVAEALGYQTVDGATVIATHLSETVRRHAGDILTRQDVQTLLDRVRQTDPTVVNELVPDQLTVGEVQTVLRALLDEGVAIKDLGTILEALSDGLRLTKSLEQATEVVRSALSRQICQKLLGPDRRLRVVTLDPDVERAISSAVVETPQGSVCALEPMLYQALLEELARQTERLVALGHEPVVLTSPNVRRHVRSLVGRSYPQLAVLSYAEVVPEATVEAVGTVRLRFAAAPVAA